MKPNDMGQLVKDEWHGLPDHFPHLRLHEFQLMPDHLHGILVLDQQLLNVADPIADELARRANTTETRLRPTADHSSAPGTASIKPAGSSRGTLGVIISAFKAAVTFKQNRLNGTPGARYWQQGYHERIISTTQCEFERIARYIAENPSKWT